VEARNTHISGLNTLERGSAPTDDGAFFFDQSSYEAAIKKYPGIETSFHQAVGGAEFIRGTLRWVVKLSAADLLKRDISQFAGPLLERVSIFRAASKKVATQQFSDRPYVFPEDRHFQGRKIFIPQILSEAREFITCGLLSEQCLVLAPHFQALADGDIYMLSLISSRLHSVWIAAVCGQLETRLRYSSTLGWNTFPVPILTEKNKADLARCAEDILLAREAFFPESIADLYDRETMPDDLRAAHERNDEVLERIYIGRRFKNDTERLEKLFELYTKMSNSPELPKKLTTRKKAEVRA
jgi:hypothetical protein